MRIAMDGARPIINAPRLKSTSAIRIVFLRPYVSLNGPPNKEPTAAPSYAKETIVY